jgi:hypothetical protein
MGVLFIQFLGCIFLVFFLSEVRWQKARSTGSKFPCVRNYNVGKKSETSEGTLVVFPSLFEKTLISSSFRPFRRMTGMGLEEMTKNELSPGALPEFSSFSGRRQRERENMSA